MNAPTEFKIDRKAVEFKLNGRVICGYSDETIIDAAKRYGVDIPHLCYLEGMRPDGNCRACMVEIKGERVLAPSCCRTLANPKIEAILVNIFGGIMRCDVIAEGVIAASKAVSLKVPLVVRMKGTNEELGRKILAESGLPIISANNMAEAAEKVVAAAKGKV